MAGSPFNPGTAGNYLYSAFRRCGQMRPGYLNNADLLADGLAEFSYLFDNWNSKRTMNYTTPDYVYPVLRTGSAAIESGQVYGLGFYVGPSVTFTGTTTSTQTLVAVPNTVGLQLGMYIAGTGVPSNTYIVSIVQGVSITMNNPASTSGTVSIATMPDWQGPRPTAILRANLVYQAVSGPPTRLPLSPVSSEEWANISVLQLTPINVTTVYYYEPSFPCGIFWAWPPLNANSIEMFTWGFLTPPTDLTTQIDLPPGYQDAMIYTLAERLWPMCTNEIAIQRVSLLNLRGDAHRARQDVKRLNAPMPRLRCDFGPGGNTGQTPACDWTLLLTGIPY